MKWKPSKIIFFDDNIKNVIFVALSLKSKNIISKCFCYKGALLSPYKCDYHKVQFQIDYLFEKEIWLNEEKAENYLSKN